MSKLMFAAVSFVLGCGSAEAVHSVATTSSASSSSSSSSSSGTAGSGGSGTTLMPLSLTPVASTYQQVVVALPGPASFGAYTVTNPNDIDVTIVKVTMAQTDPNGDNADFVRVGLGDGMNNDLGEGVFPASGPVDIDLAQMLPLVVPANSSATLEMKGQMAPVVSSAACPTGHGCARSGHTPTLAVTQVAVKEGLITATIENHPPQTSLRKTKPIITGLALTTTALVEGVDTPIARWQVAADPAGPLEYIKSAFVMKMSDVLVITNVSVRRDGFDLVPNEFQIFSPCSDPHAICTGTSAKWFYVIFTQPESISGNGHVYTLHGTPQNVKSGMMLYLTLYRANATYPATGQLIYQSGPAPYLLPDPWDPANTPPEFTGTFLWSDLSEVPHSYQWMPGGPPHAPTSFSSDDWTNDLWLNITGMTWTLTAP